MVEEFAVETLVKETESVLKDLGYEDLDGLDEEIARLDSDDPKQRTENITSFLDERTAEIADDQRKATRTFLGARISAVHFDRRHGNE